MTTCRTSTATMNFKYFCTPRLSDYSLPHRPIFEHHDELKPLAVQTTYPGLAFDFNCGMRLQIPAGNWHVKILDHDSEVVCFDEDASDVLLISLEKFFVRWEFYLWLDGQLVFHHLYDPTDWKVRFNFLARGLGDRIILSFYLEEFRKKWKCKVFCSVEPSLRELWLLNLPEVNFNSPNHSYATYCVPDFFSPLFTSEQSRSFPLAYLGQQIFGLQRAEKIIYHPTKPRQIAEPYVCIAAQASATFKAWLNPEGWSTVIDYLKRLGYRVLCIDKEREQTNYGMTIKMPEGAEDFTATFRSANALTFWLTPIFSSGWEVVCRGWRGRPMCPSF